jgi:hypothetical protein
MGKKDKPKTTGQKKNGKKHKTQENKKTSVVNVRKTELP